MTLLIRHQCCTKLTRFWLPNQILQSNYIKQSRKFSQLSTIRWDNQRQRIKYSSLKFSPNTISIRFFSWNETVIAFWKAMSNSTPVAYVQHGLTEIHDYSGLPWWASIVLSTFLFRTTITLPLTIYQNKITARIENLALEMPAIVEELKKETVIAVRQYKWSEKQARAVYNRSLKKQWNKLIVRDNCHPLKTVIVLWGQIPLWICQSVAIRNLLYMLPHSDSVKAKIVFTQLTIGGFLWIPNLTEIDASLILPVTLGILNLSIIELQTMLRTRPPTRLQKFATNFFRLLSIGMVPVAANVPSALCLYWVSSSAYGVLQNLLLVSPKIRRTVGILKVKSEHENPYQYLLMSIKKRIGLHSSKNQSS